MPSNSRDKDEPNYSLDEYTRRQLSRLGRYYRRRANFSRALIPAVIVAGLIIFTFPNWLGAMDTTETLYKVDFLLKSRIELINSLPKSRIDSVGVITR